MSDTHSELKAFSEKPIVVAVAVKESWLPSYTIDRLFIEMCDSDKVVLDPHDEGCYHSGQGINKYYLEAVNYCRRISVGNFSGKNAKYKPVYVLHLKDFSPKLQAELLDSKESLDRIITEAVFRLFRARHEMIFYEHIESQRFKWELITVQ